MRFTRFVLALVLAALAGTSRADTGITIFIGVGTPPVGCASTGVFDLSNTCNDVYFIGVLQ